jgi:hypothetical protein
MCINDVKKFQDYYSGTIPTSIEEALQLLQRD